MTLNEEKKGDGTARHVLEGLTYDEFKFSQKARQKGEKILFQKLMNFEI